MMKLYRSCLNYYHHFLSVARLALLPPGESVSLSAANSSSIPTDSTVWCMRLILIFIQDIANNKIQCWPEIELLHANAYQIRR